MALNLKVSGKGTLVVMKPLKVQLIHPPITIMGRTLVRLPLSMSIIIVGSCMGFLGGAEGLSTLSTPVSSLLKKLRLIRNDSRGIYFPCSLNTLLLINTCDCLIWSTSAFFCDVRRMDTW